MRESRVRWVLVATLAWVAAGWAGSPGAAQEGEDREELREALEERFEVRLLTDGLLLEPRDGEGGPQAIQIGEEGIALDGSVVADDELEARVGRRAARVLRAAAEVPADELRELFASEGSASPGAEPEGEDEEEVAEAKEAAEEEETAEDEERHRRVHKDTQVVVGDSVVVEEHEISDDVVVIGGKAEVLGEVRGDAVVVGGSLEVAGEVTGDAVAVGGSLELGDGARIGGDAVAVGGVVERGENVEIGGKIVETPFGPKVMLGPWLKNWRQHEFEFRPWERWVKVGWKVFWVIFLSLLACLALLIAGRPIDRMERRVEREPWKSGLVGLLAQALFVPLLILIVVVLAVSIIGIPLLLLVPFALFFLVLAGFGGFVAVARRVGVAVGNRFGSGGANAYLQAITGIVIVYGASLVGHLLNTGPFPLRAIAVMTLILGAFAWYAAWTVGFGAAVLTRFGTAESWERPPAGPPTGSPPAPPEPAPPVPPSDSGWPEQGLERDASG